MTDAQIRTELHPWLASFAPGTWGPATGAPDYDHFRRPLDALGGAPGI